MWAPTVEHQATLDPYFETSVGIPPTPGAANSNTILTTLVPDYPADAIRGAGGLPSMADWEGSGYRLRRIVGKLYAGVDQDVGDGAQNNYPEAAIFTAGFIVLRVDGTTGAPLNATPGKYDPARTENIQDPWIWRRSWILSNYKANGVGGPASAYGQYAQNTSLVGAGTHDGPHIDQKTARRVSTEERLFFVASCSTPGNAITGQVAGNLRMHLDYRLIISPLKIMGNRRNASR